MRTLNLGVLAHVDAGKTSLTERLLYAAGVIDKIGRVDDGNTQTDTLALERQRGITIKAAVVSFVIDDVTVNLIDTPGHPDFIAEVERVLNILDGAVLVISAVEGVQSQTRVLMRTLQRLRIPTLIFVNKIDRGGAQHERVLQRIRETLTPAIIAMGSTRELGSRSADFMAYGATDVVFTRNLAELLAEHDDALLTSYVSDAANVSYPALRAGLADQAKRKLVHPVFFGSAITGAGVDALMAGIAELLPAVEGNANGPISAAVFKVERGRAGEQIAYVRMFSGTIGTRDRVTLRSDPERKVTAISVFDRGSAEQRTSVGAGRIAKLWGLGDVRIGDVIGVPRPNVVAHHFAPPTLETAIVARQRADKGALFAALAQLAEQDPLINLRQDDVRQEMFVSLYGEVQKEVIQATLANDFGIDVEFRETTTLCIERPSGIGAALDSAPNPFVATVGMRIEPGAIDSGVQFRLEIEFGSLPVSFHKAIEDSARETLSQGVYGWPVTDCVVTMTHAIRLRYFGASTAAEHRNLTPLVVMSALQRAGTTVCEPIYRFHIETPTDALGVVFPALSQLYAVPQSPVMRGAACTLEGEIPAAHVHALQQLLPSLTRGEGVLEYTFDHYRAVHGTIPTRPRSDNNPLNRKEYLLRVKKHSSTGQRDAHVRS